ncbi:MAG: aldolase, partial [Sneathiella sp.]
MITLHASAVAIDGYAVILRGPSGAGKSDLALRLIDEGAILVADDYVELHARKNHIEVTAPE